MKQRLSVVIPSYYGGQRLESCLASVVRHAPPGTEILVVDDGSPGEVVQQACRAWPALQVVRLPRRGGFCRAANVGLKAANGLVVQLLNDDTEVSAGWVEAALRHFERPKVAAVAPLVLLRTERATSGAEPRIDSAGDDYDPGGYAWKRGHGRRWSPRLPACLRQSGPVTSASGCAAFYRREAVLAVGGFAESFQAYFEDVDLALRLRRQGGEILYEPASVVWHVGSASYAQLQPRRLLEQQSCNEERLFWRHWKDYGGPRLLPRHLGILLAKACRRCAEGRLLPWLFGRLRAWSELV